jgi:O-antigen/teichoic acid export membrane protein
VNPRARVARSLSGVRGLVGEQLLVTGAQLLSGVGNLAFVIIAARVLPPRGFAHLVSFLALYLVVHMPTGSLSAASTLVPQRAAGLRRRLLIPVALASMAVAASTPFTASLLELPPGMVILTAITVVAAPFLALERGPLHGFSMNGRVSLTLVVEPAIRLAVGIPLALVSGAVGGAAGVVLAGYAALGVAAVRRSGDPRGGWLAGRGRDSTRHSTGGAFWWTAAAFLLLAVFQKQDVLFANRLLGSLDAATFAAVATLGGAAVLASVRVPLVLIPRAVQGSRKALGVALALAGGLGLGAVAMVALLPDLIVTAVFPQYERAADFAVAYMTAMALLAVSRVLAAYFSATGHPRAVTGLVGSAVALHVVLLVAMGANASGVVRATLIANLVLVILVTVRAAIGWRDRPVRTPTDETHQRTAELAVATSQDPDEAGQRDQQRPDSHPNQDT